MAAKLTEITTQYHTFVDDQVLTKDQLNGFISYFEDQDRLSRVFLQGVGIVCGFNLEYSVSEQGTTITLTQGVGVTTDGDLVTLRENIPGSGLKSIEPGKVEFTHIRKFEDKFADYPFFQREKTSGNKVTSTPMEMWEILPAEAENADPLAPGDLEEKSVLLYLEAYAKDGDLCTTTDCDNQGVEQVARLRILLVSEKDADHIAKNDPIFSKHDVASRFTQLPDVAVRRVVLDELNTSGYVELKRAYHTALTKDGVLKNLAEGMNQLFSGFGNLLQLEPLKNEFEKFPGNLKKLAGFTSSNVPFDFQYRYDCVKDLADTWNELKGLLLSLNSECFPDIGAFPKHLLLGNLDELNNDLKNNRHQYYKSPAVSNGVEKIKQCRSLVVRMFEMAGSYSAKPGEIKITPSGKLPQLSYRSIPFYYQVKDRLLRVWDFLKTEKFSHKKNLSYHRDNLADTPSVQEPLNFNTDRFDFLRIEGHQGRNYKTALEEITELKEKHGLAFDVKALSLNINTENLDVDDYECEFEDLNVMLRAWTAEQECVLAEVSSFFSAFSLADPGKNIKEATKFTEATLSEANLSVDDSFLTRSKDTSTKTTGDVFTGETAGKTTYYAYKSTVVPDNLIVSDDALGEVMKKSIEENEGKSVNDVIVNSKELLTGKLSSEAWESNPELKKLVIDDSVEILAWSNELIQQMPAALRDFSAVKLESYNLTLGQLCKRVQQLKADYQKVELDQNLKTTIAVLINQLSAVCCSGKKLEVLHEEIDNRKESILLRLQLSKFVEKHPGLEHKAGVEPGGTFVLVFLNKIDKTKLGQEVLTGSLNMSEATALSSITTGSRISELEKYAEAVKAGKIAGTDISKVENLLNEERLKMAARVVAVRDIPNNTVIADFSLPYMCCSDCAPVNFIIQKPPARLLLEKDELCLGDENEIRFEVSPQDGDIQPDQEVPGMKIEDKKLIFDPEVFPDELLGKTIHFTVNQQVTEAELTVFKAPEVDFEVPESAPIGLEITFEPFGDIEGASFLWNFGDGSPASTEKSPSHRYTELPENDGNTVVVTLVVTAPNGVCSTTVEHEIKLFEIIIEADLSQRDFCENDETGHPFTLTAGGADAIIEGPGVERDDDGNFLFVPANAGVGEHRFTLNGEPSGIIATVHEAPVAAFEPAQEGNQLILTNNSTGADSFVWIVNEEEIEKEDASPHVIELSPDNPVMRWSLQLTAISEHCGSVKSEPVSFETRLEEPVDKCPEETKAAMLQDLESLQELNLPESNIVVPIWMSTSKLYGGTDEFNEGVLNDVENYLAGKNNEKLPELFFELLQQTSGMVIEMSGDREGEEYKRLVQIFALQLQLFYNVLGCQDNEVIEAAADMLARMFDEIISILKNLQEHEITLPESLRKFMESWAERVAGKGILEEHVKIIFEGNLV